VFQSALIPVSQAGSQRAGKIRNPAVGCHYFLPSAHPPSHKVPNYSLLLVSGVCAYKVVTQKQNGVSQTVKPWAYSTTTYTQKQKNVALCCQRVSSIRQRSFVPHGPTGALKMQDRKMMDLCGLEFDGLENAGLEIDRPS